MGYGYATVLFYLELACVVLGRHCALISICVQDLPVLSLLFGNERINISMRVRTERSRRSRNGTQKYVKRIVFVNKMTTTT